MRLKDVVWQIKDYAHHCNYKNLWLIVNHNNDGWQVIEDGEIVGWGNSPTVEERKAASLVFAWCRTHDCRWRTDESEPRYLFCGPRMFLALAAMDNGYWQMNWLGDQANSGQANTQIEAQLAVIMEYEGWNEEMKENKDG